MVDIALKYCLKYCIQSRLPGSACRKLQPIALYQTKSVMIHKDFVSIFSEPHAKYAAGSSIVKPTLPCLRKVIVLFHEEKHSLEIQFLGVP